MNELDELESIIPLFVVLFLERYVTRGLALIRSMCSITAWPRVRPYLEFVFTRRAVFTTSVQLRQCQGQQSAASMDIMAEEKRVKRTLTEEAKKRKGVTGHE
ncbi:hypothetical protein D9C73_014458 [Collichthys lucidus]|uniref:Uncharacterized protein n=1 Tax=Collichthys lucidus TaxID=240159 RepID=A0A4V6ASY0_COLLU|nr:hypothetical protein D9C73_014458 [Collichthys lucidus]